VTRTILIVDDHEAFRGQARMLLEAVGYEVAGEAGDTAGGIAGVRALDPDVVLLDIQLPDGDGFGLAEELAKVPHPPLVVLISSRERADYGAQLEEAPVAGFIHKSELSRARLEELVGSPA
jgi:DNA-binding NarL/FixJ family response regulator